MKEIELLLEDEKNAEQHSSYFRSSNALDWRLASTPNDITAIISPHMGKMALQKVLHLARQILELNECQNIDRSIMEAL